MVDEEVRKEDKFEFDSTGESSGYISRARQRLMISALVELTITGGTKSVAGQVGVRYTSMPPLYLIPHGTPSR